MPDGAPCNTVDCGRVIAPPAPRPLAPPLTLDTMAKDYDSFLRVLLDGLTLRAPGWRERTEADLGMALLELFAYAGDQLSHLQDRIALEGAVRTATQYESVKNLLRLVDYALYPGHAAETDLIFEATGNAPFVLPAGFQVRTTTKSGATPIVFETLDEMLVTPALSAVALAADAPSTSDGLQAVLAGIDTLAITNGTRLLFEYGGQREWVEVANRSIGATTTTLTFTTPLQAQYPQGTPGAAQTLVRGNHARATHGERRAVSETGNGQPGQVIALSFSPLTYVLDAAGFPRTTLQVSVDAERWTEVEDFVDSAAADTHYRVTRDNAGFVTVHFGDGVQGAAPASGAAIEIAYRVGVGEAGRAAADSLTQFTSPVFADPSQRLLAVRNPFATENPGEPEAISAAKLQGPRQLRRQNRAVTEQDYEALVRSGVPVKGQLIQPLQAKATYRWTGSWTTVFVSVDLPARTGLDATPGLREALEELLTEKRLAGLDVHVQDARYAPLHLVLRIDVAPEHFARDVRNAVERALIGDASSGAFFAAGRFAFGQAVHLSDLYAAVMATPGVQSVAVTRFKRLGDRYADCEAAGFIPIGAFEIARCDNDAAHPEHGVLGVRTCGGKEG